MNCGSKVPKDYLLVITQIQIIVGRGGLWAAGIKSTIGNIDYCGQPGIKSTTGNILTYCDLY